MTTHGELISFIEELVPLRYSEAWDNCGLQLGDPHWPLKGILLALDVTPEVVAMAQELGANFIFSHHPLLLTPVKTIRADQFPGTVVQAALTNGISVYAAHTNLDVIPGGVNDVLADLLGLINCKVLSPTSEVARYKLVVFVPPENLEEVSDAVFAAGAGKINHYSRCSFAGAGTGTFYPMAEATPYYGEVEEMNEVEEFRLEVSVEEYELGQVIAALLDAHPYESPAFDVYALEQTGEALGLGRLGEFPHAMSLGAAVGLIKGKLALAGVRVIGAGAPGGERQEGQVKRIAVCGGSGFSLYQSAVAAGVDLYVTGDVKYHDARLVEAMGVPVVDAGHYATEVPVLTVMQEEFRRFLRRRDDGQIKVDVCARESDPFQGW
ncbi:MAG: Nif3-like dinuclear metal center hexameric protein [Deltaproteobacteria bacterium]|nr:Nif3-like dinuclear metal center hexameric protein [Candidatus Anaeroferrophillus wilburensis]MBN2888574.1 Nif3-like dinuclear metal center hexameric protein [Deltaproteobacteria bacterium]